MTAKLITTLGPKTAGELGLILPHEHVYPYLAQNRLDYQASSFGIRVAATGTDVVLDYRRVAGEPESVGDFDSGSLQTSMGLLVTQASRKVRKWRSKRKHER